MLSPNQTVSSWSLPCFLWQWAVTTRIWTPWVCWFSLPEASAGVLSPPAAAEDPHSPHASCSRHPASSGKGNPIDLHYNWKIYQFSTRSIVLKIIKDVLTFRIISWILFNKKGQIHNGKTLHVAYPLLSISFLLMSWRLKSPEHQQAWHWPYKSEYSVPSIHRIISIIAVHVTLTSSSCLRSWCISVL